LILRARRLPRGACGCRLKDFDCRAAAMNLVIDLQALAPRRLDSFRHLARNDPAPDSAVRALRDVAARLGAVARRHDLTWSAVDLKLEALRTRTWLVKDYAETFDLLQTQAAAMPF
jgi:hypothetical protein